MVCFAGLGVINRFCIKLIDVARTLRRKGICLPRHPCVSYSLHALIRSGSSATRHPKGRGGVDTARTLRRKRICLPRRPCVSYSLHALIRSGSSATRHPKDGWLRQAPAFAASVQLPTEASGCVFVRHIPFRLRCFLLEHGNRYLSVIILHAGHKKKAIETALSPHAL